MQQCVLAAIVLFGLMAGVARAEEAPPAEQTKIATEVSVAAEEAAKADVKLAETVTASLVVPKQPTFPDRTEQAKAAAKPKRQEHIVTAGEVLERIAALYQTTWRRLWSANPQMTDPDVLQIGDKVSIPTPEEPLPDRPLPAGLLVSAVVAEPNPVRIIRTSVGGPNAYATGNCTWYVKTRRPDIGGFWGNAISWPYSARAAGYATGYAPQVGAIAVEGNHVAYVEGVSGGMVTVSEMNYAGWNVISSRTVPVGTFSYIY